MLEDIYHRYGEQLFRFLRRLLGNTDDAQDALQETFLALNKVVDLKEDTAKQYVFKVAYSKAMDIYRRKYKEKADYTNEFEESHYVFRENTPTNDLSEALTHLKEKERTVILLYYEDNYRYEEIAEIMAIPVGTVRTWLHRGKIKLKTILEVESG